MDISFYEYHRQTQIYIKKGYPFSQMNKQTQTAKSIIILKQLAFNGIIKQYKWKPKRLILS